MSKTLLAVDDSATMRKVLEITFSGEDFRVITADSSASALHMMSETPSVAVIDTSLGSDDAMLAMLKSGELEMYLGGNVFGPLVPTAELIVEWPPTRVIVPTVSLEATFAVLFPTRASVPPRSAIAAVSGMRFVLFAPTLLSCKIAF